MTRRVMRLALFLVVLISIAAAGWFVADAANKARQNHAALETFDVSIGRAQRLLSDVKSSQQAYVAAAQSDAFWRERVKNDLAALNNELTALRQLTGEAAALNDIDAVSAGLDTLSQIDDRAGRLVRNGQMKLASQIVFGEAIETQAAAMDRLNDAWQVHHVAVNRHTDQGLQELTYVLLGLGGIALLAVAMLVPRPRGLSGAGATAPALQTTLAAIESAQELLAGEPAARAPAREPVSAAPAIDRSVDETSDAAAQVNRRKSAELAAMAELCSDFARLSEPGELPGLLERAARLIDSPGLIVWFADAAESRLRPVLAYGYSAQALARLPAMPAAADNATAAAWRDCTMQVVRTNGMTPGALVFPLLTTAGCIGVLAVEVRHGRESSESIRALTRILAALLATIVSPPAREMTGTPELVPSEPVAHSQ